MAIELRMARVVMKRIAEKGGKDSSQTGGKEEEKI